MRRAVRSSSAVIVTGRDGRLLRSVDVKIELSASEQERLREALGRFTGVELNFEIEVTRPNQRVAVEAPAEARPISELSENGRDR